MRTTIINKEYLEDYIDRQPKRIEKLLDWISTGKVKEDRILSTKSEIFRTSLHLIIARYSIGQNINTLNKAFPAVIQQMAEIWKDRGDTPEDDIHFDNYVLMLWMLSLGILLEIENKDFEKLVYVLDRSRRSDYLFEFLISFRVNSRIIPDKVTYENPYKPLIEVATDPDKMEAVQKLKKFLDKEWYQGMSLTYWYNNHKSKHNTFFGYWSFESAAIAKICNLDDGIFKEHPYYPYDMVHWKE